MPVNQHRLSQVFDTLRRLTNPKPALPKVPVFITVPPDNSWGVVMAGFYCLLVAQGVAQSHGKLLMVLSHDLAVSIVQAASYGSVQTACSYFFGPVASAMVNRYGLRRAGCAGAFISTVGLLLAFALPYNLTGVLLGYGILTGIGFGISYAVIVVTVGLHFEKYRSLAIAVAMSGVGFGPVFLSPMVVYMLKSDIELKFVYLTYAGLSAISIFTALAFRDLDPLAIFISGDRSHVEETDSEITIDHIRASTSSDPKTPSFEQPEQTFLRKLCCCRRARNKGMLMSRQSSTTAFLSTFSRPLYREDIFFDRDLEHLSEYKGSTSQRTDRSIGMATSVSGILQDGFSVPKKKLDYYVSVTRANKEEDDHWCPAAIRHALALLFDFQLLRSTKFAAIAAVAYFFCLGATTPLIYITISTEQGGATRQQTVFLLSLMGASNVLGRLSVALVSFFPQLNPTCFAGFFTVLSGVSSVAHAVHRSVEIELVYLYCCCFGYFTAFMPTLRLTVCVQHLGLTNLTNAVGLTSIFMGLGAAMGPPLTGYLAERFNSFDYSFLFAGACHLVAGMIFLGLYLATRRQ